MQIGQTNNSALLKNPAATAQTVGALGQSEHFSRLLQVHDTAEDRDPMPAQEQARQAAQQLVATTFIQPLLAQIRKDPFRTPMFHGGMAEDMFASQLDTILADRLSPRIAGPIADAVYRRVSRESSKAGAAQNQMQPMTEMLSLHG